MPRTQKYYKRPANSQLFHCDSFIHCVGHAVRWAIGGVGGGKRERKRERKRKRKKENQQILHQTLEKKNLYMCLGPEKKDNKIKLPNGPAFINQISSSSFYFYFIFFHFLFSIFFFSCRFFFLSFFFFFFFVFFLLSFSLRSSCCSVPPFAKMKAPDWGRLASNKSSTLTVFGSVDNDRSWSYWWCWCCCCFLCIDLVDDDPRQLGNHLQLLKKKRKEKRQQNETNEKLHVR